jgi:hypothetical protein
MTPPGRSARAATAIPNPQVGTQYDRRYRTSAVNFQFSGLASPV